MDDDSGSDEDIMAIDFNAFRQKMDSKMGSYWLLALYL